MNDMQKKVQQFHFAFAVRVMRRPQMPDEETRKLREELIREEFAEFCEANKKGDLVEAADALGDLLYVIFGAGLTYGIDLEPIFNEIHRSNMSKGWKKEDGDPFKVNPEIRGLSSGPEGITVAKRADGKVVKSPSYTPADIAAVLKLQMSEKHTCPLRMNSFGPWERQENLDHWDRVGADRVCSFCGSMHPEQFLQICRDVVDGKSSQRLDLNDRCDKVYVHRKEVPNADYGAIKFKTAHLKKDELELVNAALLRSRQLNPY